MERLPTPEEKVWKPQKHSGTAYGAPDKLQKPSGGRPKRLANGFRNGLQPPKKAANKEARERTLEVSGRPLQTPGTLNPKPGEGARASGVWFGGSSYAQGGLDTAIPYLSTDICVNNAILVGPV